VVEHSTAAALPVDLAELLFQFGDEGHYALPRLIVRCRQHCRLAILHDLHFEFDPLIF
jgi:hypothetical protein